MLFRSRVEIENVAVPALSVPVPSVAAPSLKVTVPVAAPGVTVAVNVTACPNVEGFVPDVTVVVLAASPTTCVNTAEVLDP